MPASRAHPVATENRPLAAQRISPASSGETVQEIFESVLLPGAVSPPPKGAREFPRPYRRRFDLDHWPDVCRTAWRFRALRKGAHRQPSRVMVRRPPPQGPKRPRCTSAASSSSSVPPLQPCAAGPRGKYHTARQRTSVDFPGWLPVSASKPHAQKARNNAQRRPSRRRLRNIAMVRRCSISSHPAAVRLVTVPLRSAAFRQAL